MYVALNSYEVHIYLTYETGSALRKVPGSRGAMLTASPAQPDRQCHQLLHEARSRPPVQVERGEAHRVAVLLRGAAFRDAVRQHSEQSCCAGSFVAQEELARYHNQILFPELEADGARLDVFIATYRCTNGRSNAVPLLARWYESRLQVLDVIDRSRSDQWATTARVVELAAAMERAMDVEYDYVLVLRLDTAYGSLRCAAKQGRPMDLREAGGANPDKLQLLPRGYFQFYAQLIRPCHAPPRRQHPHHREQSDREWKVAYARHNFSKADLDREQHRARSHDLDFRAREAACRFAQHGGVDDLLRRCGETPDANASVHAKESCGESLENATRAAVALFRGGRAFKIRGGVGSFMISEFKPAGELYDPTQCGCDVSMAAPSSGRMNLEALLHNMREWQRYASGHLRAKGSSANATCSVDFDGNRITSHVNASSASYRVARLPSRYG